MLLQLPDEIVLHVFTFLSIPDIVSAQLASQRCLRLARDNSLWKIECFAASRAESSRRRQELLDRQRQHLAELRQAIVALPASDAEVSPSSTNKYERALANWDPGYPDENLDYYTEYIHRHASINVSWLDLPNRSGANRGELREATGVGAIYDQHGHIQRTVAPLDDGSICIWDVSACTTSDCGHRGQLLSQSDPGILTGLGPASLAESSAIMTETGAVECVSVDATRSKAYFGVRALVHEVDLNTLQLVSTRRYPWPVTALSESVDRTPLCIGTNWTVHLQDPRDSRTPAEDSSSHSELIGGSLYSHATLTQPGPLSILQDRGINSTETSIWVAGRFTSLLNYDLRFFPRLRGTVHSGARISSLSSIPYPYVPRHLDLTSNPEASLSALHAAKASSGMTVLAAAEYKGKGSLELYGLPGAQKFYKNRQTVSSSKLLSIAPHGGCVVVSDGDGNLKWMERDGATPVRTFNINDAIPADDRKNSPTHHNRSDINRSGPDIDVYRNGSWRGSPSMISSAEPEPDPRDDIVQKLIPTAITNSHSSSFATRGDRHDINQSDLLLWTGDGRIGLLGFGRHGANPLHRNQTARHCDDLEIASGSDSEVWHDAPETIEARAREDAERQYGLAMRRALERSADEVRFVRGLGMGFTRP